MGSIAEKWEKLSGENNWDSLLNPLDDDLRRYIIHYGERTEAVGLAFNAEPKAKGYRLSRYPTEGFFPKVFLENGNPYKYSVTSFIYAESVWGNRQETSLIAYVAVATDEGKKVLGRRDILVSWRGTKTDVEALKDVDAVPIPATDIFGYNNVDAKVHRGFHSIYTAKDNNSPYVFNSPREQVLKEITKLVEKYKDEEVSITITGYSLGGALAQLNAMDIVFNKCNNPKGRSDKKTLVTAFVFGSPRVGDEGFEKLYNNINANDPLRVLRISNQSDPVPKSPPTPYVHVGRELVIDTNKSPYLKCPSFIGHDLEVYLHGVAGLVQGKNGNGFKLAVDRDYKLINKSTDGLKDEYGVPSFWWTEKNKGMIQLEDGSWKFDDYVPPPPTA